MIEINSASIGEGIEKIVYIHPNDASKVIKLVKQSSDSNAQSKREIKYYEKLNKRCNMSWEHLPKFYGTVQTNKGKGFIVDIVRDYDGAISKNLDFYIKKDGLSAYKTAWADFKKFFISNDIMVNHDLKGENILVKKISPEQFRLVLVDSLGDTVLIKILNLFKVLRIRKITRRFNRAEHAMIQKYSNN